MEFSVTDNSGKDQQICNKQNILTSTNNERQKRKQRTNHLAHIKALGTLFCS